MSVVALSLAAALSVAATSVPASAVDPKAVQSVSAGAAASAIVPEHVEGPVLDDAGLQPYFTDRTLLDAAEHVKAGRGAQALRLLPEHPTELPVRYLRAQAQLLAGDAAGAAAAFELLATDYPALGARSRCLAANAFAQVGDLEGAARNELLCADDPVRGRGAKIEYARLVAKLGRKAEAFAVLDPFLAPGPLRPEALFTAGVLREDAGDDKQALELFRTLWLEEVTSPFADRAKEHAKELVRKLKAQPIPTEKLAQRVERLLVANQLKSATAALRELPTKSVCEGEACQPRRCTAAPAAPAVAAPETADAEAGDDLPEENGAELLGPAKAAKTFKLADAKDDEATAKDGLSVPSCAVETVAQPADPATCRVQLVRGWLARKTRAHAKALELLRPVYQRCADPDVRAKALVVAHASAWSLHDPDAEELALLAALQFPQHALADDALLGAANVAREDGDRKRERALLRRLVQGYPESDQRSEALFRLFWSFRAEGRPDRGLVYLDQLGKEYESGARGDGGDSERGRYWWGRTVAQAAAPADRPKGVEALALLARERPLTYYGLLARSLAQALDKKAVVLPPAVVALSGPLHLGLLAEDKAFPAAVELWRMGNLQAARENLLAVDMKALRKDGRRGRESALLVGELLLKLGDERMAHTLVRRELLKLIREEPADPLSRRAAFACYPLAFRPYITEHAPKQGLPPNFLQGLMREESALDPHAKSPVGARGLTQVMPATARQVAKTLGLKRFNADKLWDPSTNIQIGSAYLGRMLKTFGHPGLAAAAYNAGPGAVLRWLTNRGQGGGPFDEFVEEIPFAETRGYVKRVLRSYAAYQLLYETREQQGMNVSMVLSPSIPTSKDVPW